MQLSGLGFFKISIDREPALPCSTLFFSPTGLIIIPLTPIFFPRPPVTAPKIILLYSPSGCLAKINLLP